MNAPATLPNSLDAFWMPFTAHRAFRQSQRIFGRQIRPKN